LNPLCLKACIIDKAKYNLGDQTVPAERRLLTANVTDILTIRVVSFV